MACKSLRSHRPGAGLLLHALEVLTPDQAQASPDLAWGQTDRTCLPPGGCKSQKGRQSPQTEHQPEPRHVADKQSQSSPHAALEQLVAVEKLPGGVSRQDVQQEECDEVWSYATGGLPEERLPSRSQSVSEPLVPSGPSGPSGPMPTHAHLTHLR